MVKISDTKAYVEAKMAEGQKTHLYAKTARITAREGKVGEEIVTTMADGHKETSNTVKQRVIWLSEIRTVKNMLLTRKRLPKNMRSIRQIQSNIVRKAVLRSFCFCKRMFSLRPPGDRKWILRPAACLMLRGVTAVIFTVFSVKSLTRLMRHVISRGIFCLRR